MSNEPTTTELQRVTILEPNSMAELQQLGTLMAQSGFFSDAKGAAQACVKILAGRELGMPPIASMVGISIIAGKPVVGSNIIASVMKRQGYSWTVQQRDEHGCKLTVFHNGKEAGKTEFLKADAERAGLLGKDNWRKFPRNMYFARAISDAARTFAPEVFSGVPAYTAEEMGASETAEDGAPIAQAPLPEPLKPVPVPDALAVDVEDFRREFTAADRFGRLKTFGLMKEQYRKLAGSTIPYYGRLRGYGVEHSNEFKVLSRALACAKEMFVELMTLEAQNPYEEDLAGLKADGVEK